MAKYVFTWGDNPFFAYQDGWTEVEAPDHHAAIKAFEQFHPKRPGSKFMNCAMVYTEREWSTTQMAANGENFGHGCHERITVEVERVVDQLGSDTLQKNEAKEIVTYRREDLDG